MLRALKALLPVWLLLVSVASVQAAPVTYVLETPGVV